MNSGDRLDPQHHISRGCLLRTFGNGKVRSSAFEPRERDENCLSGDWVECEYDDPINRNIGGTIKRQSKRLHKRPQKLLILKVGDIREVSVQNVTLDVIYYPTGMGRKRNKCHCRIAGMIGACPDQELQQNLADLANRSPIVDLP